MNPHDRLRSADFKSAVSADFTIRAGVVQGKIYHLVAGDPAWDGLGFPQSYCNLH